MQDSKTTQKSKNASGAFLVGAGILLSRIAGLIRERIFAHYFGNSEASDAFKAALKIPNFLQNLFGEGVLSASFIPVYAQLLAKGHKEEASKVASIVGSLLFILTSFLVLMGVLATPFLIDLIAPGFSGPKRELTIKIVQILFPGTGFLVLSAWCLGILNSHRKFFLSYVAPVIWNITIIAVLIIWGTKVTQYNLALIAAWGLVLGSLLQFLVQLPSAIKLAKNLKPSIDIKMQEVRTILKNFFPVVIARGVVQVSAYIDNILASLLPTGAVSALSYAQTIYLLPVSLFGMSISASELPAMSQATGTHEEINSYLQKRLNSSLERVSFYIVPSLVAFILLGDIIVSAIFQTGQFDNDSTRWVWAVLIGYSIGLLASTLGRLYSSCFYSLKNTRTPFRFAILRVFFSTVLGWLFAFIFPRYLNFPSQWATAGITLAAGIASWLELYYLRKNLNQQIGKTGLVKSIQIRLWGAALIAAIAALCLKFLIFQEQGHYILRAILCLGLFGCLYFVLTAYFNISESQKIFNKLNAKFLKRIH